MILVILWWGWYCVSGDIVIVVSDSVDIVIVVSDSDIVSGSGDIVIVVSESGDIDL